MSKYFQFCGLIVQYFLVTNSKQFGYLDLFTCHCKYVILCKFDGSCESGCATGWYGSSCQKQNVAFRKPAYQSTRFSTIGRGPELVVDGNRSQYGASRCMDTGYSNNRWWSVNLTDTYPIRQILILYRNDGPYLYSLRGFKIDVIQDNGDSVECYKQPDNVSPPSTNFIVTCNETIWGSGINISSSINNQYHFLLFCEVEVYGLCSKRTYGEECENFCYCKDNLPCDYITGKCPTEGCLPGFTGSSCNKVCIAGRYGLNCSQDCNDRHCYGLQSCSFDTGKCINGCLQGYNGTDCTQADPADENIILIVVVVGIFILVVISIIGVYIDFRLKKSSSCTIDTSVVHDAITSSENSNLVTPTAGHIHINDGVEDDLPEQANDNHSNTIGAEYENENPYEEIAI